MTAKNIQLLAPKKLSTWRKISVAGWKPVGDSQVYAELKFNVEPLLKKIESLNTHSGQKITLTHAVGKIMGLILQQIPDLNSVVRFGQIYPRRDVDIFFQVAYDETELSGHVVRNIDQKSLTEIAQDLSQSAHQIKAGNDPSFKKIKNIWKFIPSLLAGMVLKLIGLINYQLNLNLQALGVPRDSFGSMMITNIGSLGLHSAFVPIPPYSHVPLVIALGKVSMQAVCTSEGEVKAQQQVNVCVTFDHRVIDGARGAKMAKLAQELFDNPQLLDSHQ